VIDASSRSRKDPRVPLILCGVNDELLEEKTERLFAIPSPSEAQLASVLLPLLGSGISLADATFLLAVSSQGHEGVEELSQQTVALLGGRDAERKAFPQRIAFNLVPQLDEGPLVVSEVRRLLSDEKIELSVTSLVAPIFHGDLLSLSLARERAVPLAKSKQAFLDLPDFKVLDDQGIAPMPMLAAGDEALHVGV
jgi:aspartate-semialdehyde dehydrogenase